MAKITASDVNALRKKTGAGMMDCKKALTEAEGDQEKAIEILRKKGQKVAAKRADRDAAEGVIIAKVSEDGTFGAVVRISSETDFVAKNQDFIDFVTAVADKAIEIKAKSVEDLKAADMNGRTVEENVLDQLGKIGEKIEIVDYKSISAPAVFAYIHPGNRLATIMGVNKADVDGLETIGKEVNMQIAAMAPIALDKDGIDDAIIKQEIEIGMDQARQEGKPEAMLEKIAMGKLNKFYKENTLLNQAFVRNNKQTIAQYLKEADKDLTVTEFYRLAL
ncbi:MAG: elongation factor Ts [Bacteroidetes bacterium]|nr:MAG: elongation factor Ts [Bacteroidota bacterium]